MCLMVGTVAFVLSGTLIFPSIYKFIAFFIEQDIENFFHTGTDKILQIVLYQIPV